MYRKAAFLIAALAVLIVSTSTVSAAGSPSAWDKTAQYGASVNETVGVWAEKLRQPLLAKKAQLEKEISAAQLQETAVTQTKTGEQINEAVGAGTVKASRPAGTPADTLWRVAKQVYLFFVVAGLFILEHRIVLYIVLALILYKLIRWVFGRFFIRTI